MEKLTKKQLKEKAAFRNKRLLEYGLKLKGLFIFSLMLTVLATLLELIGPYILSNILDKQLVERVGAKNYQIFIGLVGVYFLSIVMASIVRYLTNISFAKLSNALSTIIRKDVFRHVLSLPVQFFDKYASGKIVSRITNDTQDIRLLFQILFSQILTTLVLIAGLLIGLFLVNYKLGFISLIGAPLAYIVFKDYFKKSTRYQRDLRRNRSDLNANLAETIQTIDIVQAFNKEEDIYNDFSKVNDRVNAEGRKLATLWAYSSFNATNTIGNLIVAIVVLIFSKSFLNGNMIMTVGSLYIFIDYNRRIFQNINNIMNMIGELEKAKSAADQVFELLKEESYKNGSEKIEDLQANISFEDVKFAYNDEEYVLEDINLEVKKNQSVAFVGHTGSGKSTIMNLIYGFYKVNEGRILIDGHNIEDLDMVDLRKNMAIVFQNPYIFEGSIYENISLFDKRISKDEAELALISVGGEKLLQREDGIDTRIREGGAGFSSGERQLISFARAMVRKPKILVLDEATSNVDTETEEYIQFGVDRLKRGRTTFIIAHRLSTIRDVDMIYVLDKGKIVERGNHDSLVALGGIYAKMLEA